MFAHALCAHTVEIALAGLPPKMATCVYPLTPSPAHSSSPFFCWWSWHGYCWQNVTYMYTPKQRMSLELIGPMATQTRIIVLKILHIEKNYKKICKFLNIFRPFVNGTCYVLIQLYKLHNHLQFEVHLHSVIAVDTTSTGDDRPAENLMLS